VGVRNQARRIPIHLLARRRPRAGVLAPGQRLDRSFPLIARAALSLKAASCLIDGEVVAGDDDGMPCFDRLRYRRDDRRLFPYAFDLIELDGVGSAARAD
jgi:hypothetical protein